MKEEKIVRREGIRDKNDELRATPALGGNITWLQRHIPAKDDFAVPMGALYRAQQQRNARFAKQQK
jgi:hypothetical protein